MSGDYVLHCSCGGREQLDRTKGGTLVILTNVLPELEKIQASALSLEDIRGVVYDPTVEAISFMLEHWRHGEMSYTYTNNSNPPVILVVPKRVGLPEPCSLCKGRRLVPCPEC